MKQSFAPIVCLLLAPLALMTPASASDWRQVAPPNWIVTLTVHDLEGAMRRAGAVLDDLRVDWSGALTGVRAVADGARLPASSQEVTLGIAAPEDQLDAGYPFAVLRGDFQTLVDALQGERTGDVAILTFAGLEFAALPAGEGALVVPLSHQERARRLLEAPGDAPPDGATEDEPHADLTVRVSQLGLNLLAERAAQRRKQEGPNPPALRSLPWPPSIKWIDAAIGANAPLAERAGEMLSELSVGLSLPHDRSLSLLVVGRLIDSDDETASAPEGEVSLPVGDRSPIATLRGGGADGALPSLMRLVLAYSRGRPDVVELPEYPEAQYLAVEKKVMDAVRLINQGNAMLLERLDDDPLMSNRVALVEVRDQSAFVTAINDAVKLWNAMIVQSDANTPLVIEVDELQLLGDARPPAVRYTIDVAKAIESPPSPEVKAIVDRYFGAGGAHVTYLAPLGDGRLLIGDTQPEQLRGFSDRLNAPTDRTAAPDPGASWRGEWRVDRFAAWQEKIRSDLLRGAIGFQPATPLPAAPVQYGVTQSGNRLTIRLDAPRATVVALGHLLPGRD